MMPDTRARLIAYAPTRASWSTRCARWAAGARMPFAYFRCVTLSGLVDELGQGGAHAVLVEGHACTPQVIAATADANVPLISVGGDVAAAVAHLPDTFGREDLLQVLVVLPRDASLFFTVTGAAPVSARRVVAVIGAGGAGTSTIAGVIAQGLARLGDPVLLADLCRNASQAVLHDVRDAIDGVMEIAAGQSIKASTGLYLPSTFVSARGYNLVLGMRQPLQWVALRGDRASHVVATLRQGEGWLVCDVDADFDTQEDTGSVGVGDRHRLTTDVLACADGVVVVADASLTGMFRGVELCAAVAQRCGDGVPIVAVINRAQKGDALRPKARFVAAFGALTAAKAHTLKPVAVIAVPVFAADQHHLKVTAFPSRVVASVAKPVFAAVIAGEA